MNLLRSISKSGATIALSSDPNGKYSATIAKFGNSEHAPIRPTTFSWNRSFRIRSISWKEKGRWRYQYGGGIRDDVIIRHHQWKRFSDWEKKTVRFFPFHFSSNFPLYLFSEKEKRNRLSLDSLLGTLVNSSKAFCLSVEVRSCFTATFFPFHRLSQTTPNSPVPIWKGNKIKQFFSPKKEKQEQKGKEKEKKFKERKTDLSFPSNTFF